MKKHRLKDWVVAVRPWSFPASAMPVVVTLAYLLWAGYEVCWTNGWWALLNIIVFHAAGNTWSDYFDYKHRVDAEDTFGAKTLTGGVFTPTEIFRLSLGLLVVALLGGIGLLLRTGLPLLYIGLAGAACSLLYPPLKYRAWGAVVIFMAYAVLPTLGTAFAAAGVLPSDVLWVALPIGLITVAILHANNTRDTSTDARAGIRTLAMGLGGRCSVWLYAFEVLFPFVWVVGCSLTGVLPYSSLAVLLALVPAAANVRTMFGYFKGGKEAVPS